MNAILERVADAQNVADRLAGLPEEALLYIAGYVEGVRDRPKRLERSEDRTNGETEPRR